MSWVDQMPYRIVDLALRVAPAARRDWLQSMRNELSYLPRNDRLGFAIGATRLALSERMIEMKNIASRPIDGLILLVAAFLALAATNSGIHQFPNDRVVAISFCALALAWSCIFVVALIGRYRLLANLACFGGALSLAIGLTSGMLTQMSAANISLMRGLALEGFVLFVALFGAASFALRRTESRR